MQTRWLNTALLNLVIAGTLGALLRYAFVEELSWMQFRYVLHAHSHVAMLGWVYLALYALLVGTFLPDSLQRASKYNRLFWLTQITVIGMLFTFPLQGYAAASTTFSTLHVILSYVFTFYFFKDLQAHHRPSYSTLFAKAALIFMIISTLALWALPFIFINGLKGSALYYADIQFFLHFQFNGWFIFAVLALLFEMLERQGVALPVLPMRNFFILLVISCGLTYVLAVAWSNPHPTVFWTNSVGVLVQLAAAVFFLRIIWPLRSRLPVSGLARLLLAFAFFSFIGKVLVQTAVAIPLVAEISYTIRNYVIGFIHLMLLGMISSFLLGYALHCGYWRRAGRLLRIGIPVFLAGLVLSEAVLFLQGTMFWLGWGFLPYYYAGLFAVSVPLPLGALFLLLNHLWPISRLLRIKKVKA